MTRVGSSVSVSEASFAKAAPIANEARTIESSDGGDGGGGGRQRIGKYCRETH